MSNEPVLMAPPEYVIMRKLQYFRDGGSAKHLADIRGIIAVLGDRLDRAAPLEHINRLGLRSE